MNLIERLDRICEKVFEMPVKCCSGTRRDIKAARFSRRLKWQTVLKGLSEAEQEIKIKEWEEKYEVTHG